MTQPLNDAEKAAAAWSEYRKLEPRIAVAALRATLHEARKAGVDEFQKRGVGRRIWGSSDPKRRRLLASDVRKYIQRERVRDQGTRFESGLRVKGIPALVLTGGRSRPFTVDARGKVLAFQRGGDRIFTRRVNIAQGVRYQQQNFLRESKSILEREYPRKVEKSRQRSLKRLGLL